MTTPNPMTEACEYIVLYWYNKYLEQINACTKPKELWKLIAVHNETDEMSKLRLDWDNSLVNHCKEHTAIIDPSGAWSCTCPDHQYRRTPCKHLNVLAFNATYNY